MTASFKRTVPEETHTAEFINIRTLEGAAVLDAFDRKYADPVGEPGHDGADNMILTENLRLSLDTNRSCRNLNTIIFGDPSYHAFYGPNLLRADSSYIVQDINGALYEDYGDYLKEKGYGVRCLDFKDIESFDMEELKAFGVSKKALFVKIPAPFGDDSRGAEFFGKALDTAIDKTKQHDVHTAFMLPFFTEFGRIPNENLMKLFASARPVRVSVLMGAKNLWDIKKVYKKDYMSLLLNCDVHLFFGAVGFRAWFKYCAEMDYIIPEGQSLCTNECIAVIRRTPMLLDRQYNIYNDERYKYHDGFHLD